MTSWNERARGGRTRATWSDDGLAVHCTPIGYNDQMPDRDFSRFKKIGEVTGANDNTETTNSEITSQHEASMEHIPRHNIFPGFVVSIVLATCATANWLQDFSVCLQVPAWNGTCLLGRDVYSSLSNSWATSLTFFCTRILGYSSLQNNKMWPNKFSTPTLDHMHEMFLNPVQRCGTHYTTNYSRPLSVIDTVLLSSSDFSIWRAYGTLTARSWQFSL